MHGVRNLDSGTGTSILFNPSLAIKYGNIQPNEERQTEMSPVQIHADLSRTALIYFALLAIWGLIRFVRHQGVGPSYWGALVIAELLILTQGSLGAILWYGGLRPARGVHLLYGLVSALAIPAVYAYTRGREERSEMLMYGVATMVTVALVVRAIMTAG